MPRLLATLSTALLIGLILPTRAEAEWRDRLPDDLRVSGRYFWAAGYSFERPYIDDGLFAELNLRLNGRYTIDPDWKLEFAYQVDGTYAEGLGALQLPAGDGLMDLRWPLEERTNWRASHGLDRLDLIYRNGNCTLDIGRQRIAWRTAFTMSIMDMFHPVRPGDPFVPEQPGTDAVRLQIATGPTSGWDTLYAWFDDEGGEAVAARYHDVHGDFESAWSVGRIWGESFAEYETSGDVNDIGIRIEAAWRDSDRGNPFQLAFETDFAPNNSTYICGEVLYNGPGGTKPTEYDLTLLERGGTYLARWYAGLNCTYNPGGLSTLGILGIANLSDDSWFADVSLQHSLSNSSDLRIGYQHYEGDLITQYGALPDMLYLITSVYF